MREVRDELVEAAPRISEMAIEAERRRREEQARREEEHRRRLIAEARRAYSNAIKASRADLLSVIEAWSLAMRVEQFFNDVERNTIRLSAEEKNSIVARAARARELLGDTDALRRLLDWKAPIERLDQETIALLPAGEDTSLEDEA